ncbi:MAG: LacI family DNA-binding transcriptional regulator [Anaerolineales bacterium]|jgi:LacI family transcriptional regulator
MPKRQSITIHDVAKVAGVSVSTVSRVLNEKDDVAEQTYEKVKGVIEELGYSSNLAARSMRSRKTNVIGLIMPDVTDPFSTNVAKGVNQAMLELNYDLIIYTSGDVQKLSSSTKEQQFISSLNNSFTDGVIIVTPTTGHFISTSPVVAVDPNIQEPSGPAVISTNHKGAIEATKYLIDLGHRRIAHIGGRLDLLSAIRRKAGYKDALKNAGIEFDPALFICGDYTREMGRECAQQLLNLENPPTAIFASNDQTAFGVYEVAESLNFHIPQDLSVVGFDNVPESRNFNLTTVDQHIDRMGYAATKMLIALINGNEIESTQVKIHTELVLRESTMNMGKLNGK